MIILSITANHAAVSYNDIQTQSESSFPRAVSPADCHTQIDAGIILNSCEHCHIESSKLLACGRCKEVHYCGRKCQMAAWKTHQIACLNNSLIPKSDEIVCKLKDSTGVRELTQKEFKEHVKSTFVTAALFSKKARSYAEKSFVDQIESQKTIIDSVALYHQGESMGYGVVALRDIRKNEVICSFGGVAIPKEEWDGEIHSNRAELYSAAGADFIFDPSKFASLGAFVNDGPPNSELQTLSDPKVYADNVQVPLDKAVVAVRDINAGETIYVDYGWDHGIKKAPYVLDENAARDLLQKFSEGLDIALLNKTGWVFTSINQDVLDTSDLVRATEIEYILTTPYVLALLHLKTALSPKETLINIKKLSLEIRKGFKTELEVASIILMGVAKVNQTDKEEFLTIIDEISQESLISLCRLLIEVESQPSMEDCRIFGKALDKLRLTFCGSLTGFYWTSAEGTEFKKTFLGEEHQRSIHGQSTSP